MFKRRSASSPASQSPPVGLLAGWGHLPLAVVTALREQGQCVAGVGVIDHADPQLADLCDTFEWIGLGSIGSAIRHFRRAGVTQATMVGKIHKVLLYQPRWWLKHRPDWTTIKAFAPQIFWSGGDRKDDTLLTTVVNTFAEEGITMLPATDFAPELLAKAGHVAGRQLSTWQQHDVAFGWDIARQMGGLDIGQSVCIKNQTVLAVEAIEGTDECIRRAGELCPSGGFALVKVAKPQQDMRFDVPTVGVGTLESLAAAGGQVLVIEAGKTILLDCDEFARAAKRLKLTVVAVSEGAIAAAAA